MAIIWAATPKPFDCLSGALSAESADDGGDEGVGDEVFEDSIRESGGAIAAPPEVAVEKQSQLVEFKNDANIPIYEVVVFWRKK